MSSVLVDALLPEDAREPVLGDLAEEGLSEGTPRHLAAVVALAAWVHVEPYRSERARVGAAVLALAGLGLIWVVRAASWPTEPPLELFHDPLSRAALQAWSATHLTSSAAAGLVMGHAPGIPRFAEPARWHGIFLVALVAGWVPAAAAWSPVPAVLLVGCAWLGRRAARELEQSRPAR